MAGYRCFPVLNACAPSVGKLVEFLDSLDRETGVLYIHCAKGHGRTGLFAVALL